MYPNLKKYIENNLRNARRHGLLLGILMLVVGLSVMYGSIRALLNLISENESIFGSLILLLFALLIVLFGLVLLIYNTSLNLKILSIEDIKQYFPIENIDQIDNEINDLTLITKELQGSIIKKFYSTKSYFINDFDSIPFSSIISITSKRIPFFETGRYSPNYRTIIKYRRNCDKIEEYVIEFYWKRTQKKVVEHLRKMNPSCKIHY